MLTKRILTVGLLAGAVLLPVGAFAQGQPGPGEGRRRGGEARPGAEAKPEATKAPVDESTLTDEQKKAFDLKKRLMAENQNSLARIFRAIDRALGKTPDPDGANLPQGRGGPGGGNMPDMGALQDRMREMLGGQDPQELLRNLGEQFGGGQGLEGLREQFGLGGRPGGPGAPAEGATPAPAEKGATPAPGKKEENVTPAPANEDLNSFFDKMFGPEGSQPAEKGAPAKPAEKAAPAKPVEKAAPAKPAEKAAPAKAPAWIGLRVRPATEEDGAVGVLVESVTAGGPGDTAQLKEGDIITKIGGADIASTDDLRKVVSAAKAGDKTQLVITRDGKKKNIEFTYGERK
ncbi:MAG: PDZ domain-containing protein [Planctomycetes bacterium]|nr:PDZ domain-containing protein [Planctomycetota bacterium]